MGVSSLTKPIQEADSGPASESKDFQGISFESDNLSIKQHSRSLEIALIRRALEKTGGNRTHAAKVLEISHRALLYKLKEYGLSELGK